MKAPVGLWKWLSQEQPAIAALGALSTMVIGLGGLGFGILTYVNDDDGSASLEQAAVSIERRLGPDATFYDVRDIIVAPEEIRGKLPQSQFFTADGFYAISDDDLGDWTYDEITEPEFYELVLGEAAGDLSSLPPLPVHLWRSEESRQITEPGEINSFDYVFVERVPLEQLSEIFKFGLEAPESIPGEGADTDEAIEKLAEQYRGDSAGALLVGELQFLLPYGVPSVRPVLNSVQKTGNVVYANATLEFEDAVIDGETHERFFLEREIMIVSTATDVWLIQTSVGSDDRLGPSFQWIDDWFLRFGIVEDA